MFRDEIGRLLGCDFGITERCEASASAAGQADMSAIGNCDIEQQCRYFEELLPRELSRNINSLRN
jgi:hypothetical protein